MHCRPGGDADKVDVGIGAAFAHALASSGANLILVARSQDKPSTLASELADKHHIRAEVLSADLSRPGAGHALFEAVQQRGLSVDILINNAGFGTRGPFENFDAEREQQEVMLNIAAVVDLTHSFLPAMSARRSGSIINVASTAGFQPWPYMAVYGASKAFVLSFSEALWAEYCGKGVRVLANALAWMVGMVIVFVGTSFIPPGGISISVAFMLLLSLFAAGAAVGAVHGLRLIWLLRSRALVRTLVSVQ